MTCRRAHEIDLAAALTGDPGPDWAAFRDHYPRCPECAAEVRAWTRLQATLTAGAPSGHPAPARLVDLVQRASTLPPAEWRALEAHVLRCPTCRDEVTTLRTFDFAALAGGHPARAATVERFVPRRGLAWPAWADLRWLVRHPAFALALVAVVLVPALVWRSAGPPPPATGELRERDAFSRDEGGTGMERLLGMPPPAALADRAPTPPLPSAEMALPKRDPGGPAGSLDRALQAPAPLGTDRELLRSRRAETAPAVPSATAEPGAAPSRPIHLSADAVTAIARPGPSGELLLAVPVSTPALHTVRLIAPDGRTLEAPAATDGDAAIVRVPAAWLLPGDYRIEAPGPAGPRAFRLRVLPD